MGRERAPADSDTCTKLAMLPSPEDNIRSVPSGMTNKMATIIAASVDCLMVQRIRRPVSKRCARRMPIAEQTQESGG